MYSKTCVKRQLSKRPKIGFQDQLLLDAGQKYCRMLQGAHSAIVLTFIKLPSVIKIFVYFCAAILHRFYCTYRHVHEIQILIAYAQMYLINASMRHFQCAPTRYVTKINETCLKYTFGKNHIH